MITTSLLDILSDRAKYQSDRPAYIFLQNGETESGSLTYGELDRQARAIAAEIQSWQGERALLMYPSGLEFITAFFGCLYAGVIAVPVYPPRRNQNMSRLQTIVFDSQATLALTTMTLLSDIENSWSQDSQLAYIRLLATDNIPSERNPNWQQPLISSNNLAFLQYTSGSTGTPKGVMVNHANLLHNSNYIKQAFELTSESVSVSWLPSFHDMGLIDGIIQPLYTGFLSILMPPAAFVQQPIRWLEAITHYRATHCGGPDFGYSHCISKVTPAQRQLLDLSSWSSAYSGAEPVRRETLEQFTQIFEPHGFDHRFFYPCYGMAETTLMVSGGLVKHTPVYCDVRADLFAENRVAKTAVDNHNIKQLVGSGRAWLDVNIVIVDPELQTRCEPDRIGEIWVSGVSVAQGYWNRPEATTETFQAYLQDTGEGPFLRTGDLGFLDNEELFVTGRLKDVIIIRGRNHYPQDIELTVEKSHPALRKSCSAAFAIKIDEEERLIVLCEVERTHLRKLNFDEVITAIKIAVSTEHELDLHGIVLLKTGSISKTSSGKIQRSACKTGFLAGNLNIIEQWEKQPCTSTDSLQNLPSKSLNYQEPARTKAVAEIEVWLANKIAEIQELSIESIDLKQPLAVYGLNSVKAISISAELGEWLGISVAPTIIYDYPSIQSLAEHLGQPTSPWKSLPVVATSELETEVIAIVGKGCRLPQANNPEAFWNLLRSGQEAITKAPISRCEDLSWGGFLDRVDRFDPQFFNISPREAHSIDPQQRLLLEVSWEALENAGLSAEKLAGSRSGVFIGISSGDYAKLAGNLHNTEAYYGTGNALSLAANRLSYFLDWHGPSWAVDTACSSSLVAVHQACQSLLLGECNLALAGGVNLILSPQLTQTFTNAKMIAADGRCKTFDAEADGYVRSEGCGVVVLKRLSDAIADGDNIQAIIRGSAVNQDGLTNGITAPNGNSQQEVIRLALANAGVKPNQISYVETHGTGTALGDPIEINSLTNVLMEERELNRPCWIGSAKTNIGHLEAAAGIAGLIKVVLSLEHGEIPPHLHLKKLNPYIELDRTVIEIPTQLQPWSSVDPTRIAGVSAFGFGGTNAHVILESAPVESKQIANTQSAEKILQNSKNQALLDRPVHLLTLSAKTARALQDLVLSYQEYLDKDRELSVSDICFSANTGRSHFNHRLAIITSDKQELADKLAKISTGAESSDVFSRQLPSNHKSPKIAYLFTGQGSQYINMGCQLYETQPTFRQVIDECAELMEPYLDRPLLSILYPEECDRHLIDRTIYAQPTLFALEYALCRLWQSWGVLPDAVLGHSVGEYVAAVVAGVLNLADGVRLVTARAKLMQSLPSTGEMIAVFTTPDLIQKVVTIDGQSLSFAAYNNPQNTVISGDNSAIAAACDALTNAGIGFKKLRTSHAFHSVLMEPILTQFRQVTAAISYHPPQIPLISNLTGQQIGANEIDAEYWCQHLRQTVKFADGLQTLDELGVDIFLEIGPKPTLIGIGQQCLAASDRVWLSSLRPKREDWEEMLTSLARLAVNGAEIDWVGFDRDFDRQRISLPTYPFQRKSYWIDPPIDTAPLAPIPSNQNLSFTSQNSAPASVDMINQQRQQDILAQLHTSVAKLLKANPAEVDVNAPFLEMGADSLVLVEAIGYVERTFGIKIGIRQIFEEFTTIALLAEHIHQQLPAEIIAPEPVLAAVSNTGGELSVPNHSPFSNVSSDPKNNTSNGHDADSSEILPVQGNNIPSTDYATATSLERIMQQQMQIQFQLMSKQLDIVRSQNLLDSSTQDRSVGRNGRQVQDTQLTESIPQAQIAKKVDSLTNNGNSRSSSSSFWRFDPTSGKQLSDRQQRHLAALVARYTQRTQKSKQRAQSCRSFLADKRAAIGFRFETKEMIYPITGERSLGSKVWDLDGNEYIDISMGFGVHLFGHSEPFIMSALEGQLQRGFQIGPLSQFSDKVALLISELTGMERVCFANSGTEAVMTAIRLARATTGRNLIVIFKDAYHGHFDGVLAVANKNQGQSGAAPMAPGVTQDAVNNVLVLAYDDPASLEVIQAHAHELAAVVVEPVPSRRPDVQPTEFLQQLRQLTQEIDAALIFDEVITGFRIHPGGAQAWFGVEADIATYGKIVGGGMPIGVIAGKAMYLDGIDGGSWNYGDESYPAAETTFFAGTFSRNPLAMAAAHAVLSEVKSGGLPLYQRLNQRTTELAQTVNAFFTAAEVPIQIVNFGSLFRFAIAGNASYLYQPLEMDLFYHHLIDKGVYVWEGRTCFLSTAHTDEDINYIIQAIQATVRELQDGGFWLQSSSGSTTLSSTQQQTTVVSFPVTAKLEQPDEIVNVPLTKAQQQLWFLSQLGDNSSAAYNESTILQLWGGLNIASMQQALQTVVDRHEALRTRIDRAGDVQQIFPSVKIDVPVIDFSDVNDDQRESQVTAWLQEDGQTPFDFTKNSLFRCQILKLEAQQHLLVVSAHHIITDGWSMGIMLQEIAAIYSAECQGTDLQLPSPRQFREYAQWLEQQVETAAMATHQSYWLEQLYDPIPVLELPTDRPRRATKTFRANRQTIRLETNLSNDLRKISREQGCTLFMTMLSAYKTLLHRLTGQSDILIGIPAAGRSLEGSQELIGYCTHLLPIRSQFVDNPSFLEYLRTLRGVLLDAYEHQDYPFANLLDLLSEQRKTNHVPLITATFNLEPSLATPEMPGLDISLYAGPIGFADYDLSLNVIEVNTELLLSCDYSTDLFDAATISRMLGHFQTLLTEIVANPDRQISTLPILTNTEQQQLLVDWNDTHQDYPQNKCIHQLFEEQVAKTPDAIAVVFEQQELTYQQLNQRANQLAHHLQTLGVKPEVLVGICVERSLEMMVGLLGILKAGGAYVPLDPSYPAERLSYMLSDAGIEVLLTQNNLLSTLPSHSAQVVCLDTDGGVIESHSQDNLVTGVSAQNLAYVIYTSGSTGQPKGVMINHHSLVDFIKSAIAKYELTDRDRVLQFASIGFDAAAEEIYPCLSSGGTLVLRTEEMLSSTATFLETCQAADLTVLDLPTAYWHQMVGELVTAELVLPQSLRLVIIGGERVTPNLVETWQKYIGNYPQLINSYGPTEATVVATTIGLSDLETSAGLLANIPIGRPLANTQVYILDPQMQPVPIGVAGELHIGGDGLARGYLNRPELTQAKFGPNPFLPEKSARLYKTGDLARYLPDGNIEFLGRIDHQVKIRGFRIELGEIEAVLSHHPQIQQTVAIVTTDLDGNQRLVAYVVSEEAELSTQQLREFLRHQLPGYMIPSAFVILDTLPLTPNGKVDRKALPAPDVDIEREHEYVAPQTPNQEIIAHIFATVLGIETVSIHDNFFELGGHSLLATQLTSRLKQSFTVDIPLRAVFEAPTVAQLDLTINQLRTEEQGWSLPAITRIAPESESIPLSFAQERLWFLNQLEGASATYNMPAALRLTGELNLDAFDRSLAEIVRRHESLRTSILTIDGTPQQMIHSSAKMGIEVIDLQHLSDDEQKLIVEQQIQQSAITPFDLEIAPLIRCGLLQLSGTDYVFCINMHHIVSDGWSIGVFVQELSALYPAFCNGNPSPLPELAIQYADFAVWQRQWLSGEVLERQIHYWESQLQGAPELLQLPTDRPRPSVQTYRGATHSFSLSTELTQSLQALSRQTGSTLYMTLLAAFATLLYRYTGESDVVIGSSIANRNRSEIEPLIGFFVNTLVLRTRLEEQLSFEQLLTQVRATTLTAYEHQDVPFEQVVEALQPQRSLSHSPLFQVLFELQNTPMGEIELPGVKLSELNAASTVAKFDLNLSMSETPLGLDCDWEYNTDLFDGSTIERMARHFENLLSAIIENPHQAVSELPLLSAVERQQLLIKWNDTQTSDPLDQCFPQLFEAQVARTPEAIAVVCGDQQLTYQELNLRANRWAHQLVARGVESETLIALLCDRNIDFLTAMLAVFKAGGAYLPLNPDHPAERIRQVIEQSQVALVLTASGYRTQISSSAQILLLEHLDQAECSSGNLSVNCTPHNLAYVIYTSGSTGTPKGAMLEHRGMLNHLYAKVRDLQLTAADIVAQTANQTFDISIWQFLVALMVGGRVEIISQEMAADPVQLRSLVERQQISILEIVPSLLRAILQQIPHLTTQNPVHLGNGTANSSVRAIGLEEQLESLRWLMLTGEALSPQLCRQWFEICPTIPMMNAYGPTECSDDVTHYPLAAPPAVEVLNLSIGRPVANTQLYILDPRLQPLPIGVTGELYVGGVGVGRGYLNHPQLTQVTFIPDPFSSDKSARLYKTGDLVRYLSDGNIEFLGRIDHQVKIRGFRIELGEIEAVLSHHLQIQQAVVISTEDSAGNQRLVAYVVSEAETLTHQQLREFLAQQLPAYMVPSAFVILDSLPLTPNGKVDRQALPAPAGEIEREHEYVAPQTEIEQILTTIWQELLLRSRISIHDNFFEIGGDSILSIQVVSRAKTAGVQITPKQIFQHQTIAALARVANTNTIVVNTRQDVVIGVAPLTPIQHWFWANHFIAAHHYNQSVLLQTPPDLSSEFIATACQKLLEHHDALRLRFPSADSDYQQINHGLEETVPFSVIDLSTTPIQSQPRALAKIATDIQASLDLSSGPIMQVVLFDLGSNQDGRLLIIIHHLAVDGVSWRILLSDLEVIYQQLTTQQPIQLSPKTTAFIDWAEKLHHYAQSEILKLELDYWLNQSWERITPIPLDLNSKPADNTIGSTATVSITLSALETHKLLGVVHEAYNTQVNDLLLTGLALTLAEWTGNFTIIIDLEGHGREELFEDVDLSRTVGWFTSLFPVLLQLPRSTQPATAIKSIKEQLRAIPQRGLGYGILRYLCTDTGVKERLQSIPTPEISFNYLGQFDQIQSDTGWKFAPQLTGQEQSSRQQREHTLELDCLVMGGKLQIDWNYSSQIHHRSTIEDLAQSYLQNIKALIAHCQLEDAVGYTPSDFPQAQLDQSELDELLAPIHAKNIEAIYPLSPMQQGMLFHSLYAPESGVYVEQMTLMLTGDINVSAFKSTWQKVVDRYSILRTLFIWENRSTPLQIVLKQVELPWTNLNWLSLSLTEQQQQLSELLQTQRAQGFQFSQAPLMGCTLVQLHDDTYQFIWNFHHILLDGWCLPIIFKEILSFYEAEIHGETCHLPTPVPYRNYIAWLNAQDQAASTDFWRETLSGFNAPTSLAVDRTPQGSQQPDSNYQALELRLSTDISRKLSALAQQHHVTLSTIIQAAWGLLLSRYSGEPDIIFGVTVSGRPASLSEVENMVGLFINTLPLRLRISPGQQLIPWLEQIQQLMLELQHYSYTPLVEIQSLSEISGGTPLVESIVVFENYPMDSSLVAGNGSLHLGEIESYEQTNYPLTVVAKSGNELSVQISYDSVQFAEDTIERMLGHLQTIFSAIAKNPHQAVSELPLLSAAERQQLLFDWNDTQTEYPQDKCIHQLFEEQVAKTPDAVAVVFEQRELTYQQLNQRANQLAHHLQTLGVKPEVLVGICVERSLEMIVGLLGILKAGGAYVPLDPSYPSERLSYMLSDAGIEVLLTQENLLSILPSNSARMVCFDTDQGVIESHSQENLMTDVSADNLAYVIYTSGSTGQPKGVAIEHKNVMRLFTATLSWYQFNTNDVWTNFHSIAFDFSVWEIWGALFHGGRLVIIPYWISREPQAFYDLLCSERVTVLNQTPSAFGQLMGVEKFDDTPRELSLRLVIFGGEALELQSLKPWFERHGDCHPQLVNMYGITETTVHVTYRPLTIDDLSNSGSVIGRPLPDLQMYILDDNLQPVPFGVKGQMYVGGDGLARGYLNRQQLSLERFIPHPFNERAEERLYKTGDLARYLPNGEIEYLGRIDHQVKIRGFRIELGEIEAVISQHPQVAQVVAIDREDISGTKQLVAYVITQSGAEISSAEIKDFVKEKIPNYMVPGVVMFLDSLPLTPNGKLDRQALPQPDMSMMSSVDFVPPRTHTEAVLADIWRKVLKVEKIGIHDNFFDLGGHSLFATQVSSQISEALNVKLPLKSLFEASTLTGLATKIDNISSTLQAFQNHSVTSTANDLEEGTL